MALFRNVEYGGLTLAGHHMPTKSLYHCPPQQDGVVGWVKKRRWKKKKSL